MSVLKIKDQNNDWIQIPTIKGEKGDPFTYADFTIEQLESLKGKDGISPTVSVASDTSDDYRLSFTDETHTVTTPNLIPEAEKILSVYPHDSASGSIASFPDGADDIPLKSCIVQIEPVQAGEGDPSPENVRPITGWTGCKIYQADDTALPPISQWVQGFVSTSGNITGGGGERAERSTDFIPVKPSKNYTFKYTLPDGLDSEPWTAAGLYNSNKNFIDRISRNRTEINFTTTAETAYIRASLRTWGGRARNLLLVSDDLQTYPVTFPTEAGTVYGGYADVVNGELVVDRATVVLGSLNFRKDGDREIQRYYTNDLLTLIKKPSKASKLANIITSCFKVISQSESWSQDGTVSVTIYGSIYFMTSAYSTVSDFKTAMSDVQLCYELATPIHYPLTPAEIKTLLGQNNIWADTGDTEVEYRASTKMYIDRKITEAVAAALNS